MTRNKDPFAGVKLSEEVGLDQRLFEAPPVSPTPDPEPPDERTSVRKDERTSEPPESRTSERKSVPKDLGRAEGKSRPSQVRTVERTVEGPGGRSKDRQSENRDVRNSRRPEELPQWPGQKQRLIDHRPYDFFQDQIRWLNRKKLELEEEYGKRVPATAMVQLAVDLLIADHELNGEDSQLIRVLIKDERPFVPKSGSPDVDQSEEAGDG